MIVANHDMSARQKGCWGMNPDKPKRRFYVRRLAEEFREKLIDAGASPALLNVYGCRYAPKGEPHYHVGHLPGVVQNYGRMPAREKPGKKRRHSR